MSAHIAWPSIALLHNVRITLEHLGQYPTVRYRAKVKLHGTNTGVQITPEGVLAQSRTQILDVNDDYKGFAKWVKARESLFAKVAQGTTVFGEWCGPGVEKGMAISQVKDKIFAVFGLQLGTGVESTLVVDPEEIRARLPEIPGLHVLPWEEGEVTLNFGNRALLEVAANEVNAVVEKIEAEDPWVKKTFGATGVGEGLVFYPVANGSVGNVPVGVEDYARLMWKAKGEKHRTAGTKVAVQVDPEVVESIDAFVALMVTEARLAQGLKEACGGEASFKHMAAFLRWVTGDVEKESKAELAASGLTFSQVEKAVTAKAREWLKARAS
jgi:hypothetical protein